MALDRVAQRARASLIDYRDTTSEYDAVVSIEMLEAVGERHWPTYFRTLRERLKPGARAVLQVITIAEQRFEAYRRNADFIQRHVFPGGMLPSPSVLRRHARAAGRQIVARAERGDDDAAALQRGRVVVGRIGERLDVILLPPCQVRQSLVDAVG